MSEFILISPTCEEAIKSERINLALEYSIDSVSFDRNIPISKDSSFTVFTDMDLVSEKSKENFFQNKRILFAICIGASGINLEYYKLLKIIRLNPQIFKGSVGGIVIDGKTELFTKNLARELAFTANMHGLALPGKSLVEATCDLKNFSIQAKNMMSTNSVAYMDAVSHLVKRILSYAPTSKGEKILVLHSGQRNASNTIDLWDMVKKHVEGDIKEISLRNGEIFDCQGCTYEVCKHFGQSQKCYYGGVITKDVYPGILEADTLVLLCPNYNDAIGAHITAFINRLTALFFTRDFSEKKIYGLVVSGYSGGDILGGQIISALNINKGFILPPKAILTVTSNNPGSLKDLENIKEIAKEFGSSI